MQPDRRIFATLDGIRGVAAIAVVALHTRPFFGNWTPNEAFLAVDMFFVLSGVVIANAYEHRLRSVLTGWDFVKIRLIRLYPLYILGTVIGLLAILLDIRSSGAAGALPSAILLAIIMLPDPFVKIVFPINPPAWSLFFELFVNVVYAFTFRFLSIRVLTTIMVVSALGLVGILCFQPNHNLEVGWTAKNLSGGFFRVGYSFFAGVLLYRLFASRKLAPNRDWRTALIPWVILGLVAMVLGGKTSDTIEPFYQFAAVTLLFPAIVYAALWFEPMGFGARVCKFLGATSYAVYAIHVPLFWLFRSMVMRVTSVPLENLAPWVGFCFIGVLLPFCLALDKFYDTPLRGHLSAWGQLKHAAQPEKSESHPRATGAEHPIKQDAA
jgi:peptidoglycan/LPS O-acetylase OafA/YrhL